VVVEVITKKVAANVSLYKMNEALFTAIKHYALETIGDYSYLLP